MKNRKRSTTSGYHSVGIVYRIHGEPTMLSLGVANFDAENTTLCIGYRSKGQT